MPKKLIGANTKTTAAKERKSLAKEEPDLKKKWKKKNLNGYTNAKKSRKKMEKREE